MDCYHHFTNGKTNPFFFFFKERFFFKDFSKAPWLRSNIYEDWNPKPGLGKLFLKSQTVNILALQATWSLL